MSELKIQDHLLPGVVLLDCPSFGDARRSFIKLHQEAAMNVEGIAFSQAGSSLRKSATGVFRGMHSRPAKKHKISWSRAPDDAFLMLLWTYAQKALISISL
jgi:dTDP-4-dehydrorhamnose 3,5-epimerase-like enzyme